jgi:hypothetical protein
MSSLINRKAVKQFALSMAENRAHQFTRVSAEFFTKADAHLRIFIRQYVSQLPSKGKTIA